MKVEELKKALACFTDDVDAKYRLKTNGLGEVTAVSIVLIKSGQEIGCIFILDELEEE